MPLPDRLTFRGPIAPALLNLWAGFERWLHRLSFNRKTRADVWDYLAMLIEQKVELSVALATTAQIYKRRKEPSIAFILMDLRKSLANANFANRAAYWSPGAETILFSSYGQADTTRLFRGAARIAKTEDTIITTIREAMFVPVLLIVGMLGLFYYLGVSLYPIFEEIVPRDEWSPTAKIISGVSYWMRDYWFLIAPTLIALIAWLSWLMPNWSGPGRTFADRFPPFSFYRLKTGYAFLLAVVEQAQMGAALAPPLLQSMAEREKPYVRSRIMTIHPLLRYTNLGHAALQAGQGFPDDEEATVIAAFATGSEWIAAYAAILERSIEASEQRVARMSRRITLAAMALLTVVLTGTGSTFFSIPTLIN